MLKRGKKILVSLIVACLMLSQIAFAIDTTDLLAANMVDKAKRLYGADRYKTATEISKDGWQSGSEYAVLARGDDFPDALCAAPLAKKYNAPVLLTQPEELNTDTLDELRRLKVKNVFIIGGTGAVSAKVEETLRSAGITNIERIWGASRYATSVEIAKRIGASENIALATGENYPDAISIAPVAAAKGMPILLTQKENLPSEVKEYIASNKIVKTYIAGGYGVISGSIDYAVPGFKRLSGKDRYETNISILKEFEKELDFSYLYVAVGDGPSGNEFADALTGAAIAAQTFSPVVLVYNTLSDVVSDFIKSRLLGKSIVVALGGKAVVPPTAINILVSYIPITAGLPPAAAAGGAAGGPGGGGPGGGGDSLYPLDQAIDLSGKTRLKFVGNAEINLAGVPVPAGSSVEVENAAASIPNIAGVTVAGGVYNFIFKDSNGNALNFNTPVTISIPLNQGADASRAAIFYLNEGTNQWEAQTSSSVSNGVATAQVTHFSKYGVLTADQSVTPTASPSGGIVTSGTTITLSAANNAKIYYTTDGSDPKDPSNDPEEYSVSNKPVIPEGGAVVKAVAAANNKRVSSVATFNYTTDANAPKITAISFGDAVTLVDVDNNIVSIDLRGIAKKDFSTANITASKVSSLTMEVNDIGPIGVFGLRSGVNTIADVDISSIDVSNINSSKVNFTSLFNTLRDSSVDRGIIFTAVDFRSIFDEIKKSDINRSSIYNAINYSDIFNAIKYSNVDKDKVYNSIDFQAIFNAMDSSNIDKQKIKDAIDKTRIADALRNSNIDFDSIKADIEILLDRDMDYHAMARIFDAISKSNASRSEIFNAINFTSIFEAVSASNVSRAIIVDAVNYTQIFEALRDSNCERSVIVDAVDFGTIFNNIQSSNIDRNTLIQAVDFTAIFRAVDRSGLSLTLFNLLESLDGGADNMLSITATLDDGNKQTVYTIRLILN